MGFAPFMILDFIFVSTFLVLFFGGALLSLTVLSIIALYLFAAVGTVVAIPFLAIFVWYQMRVEKEMDAEACGKPLARQWRIPSHRA